MVETETPLDRTVGYPRVGALKYLSALQKRVEEIEELVELGLMYVGIWVNHKAVRNTNQPIKYFFCIYI